MALLLNAGDTVLRSYSYTQPSPLHPSQPQGTGDRTGNLFDWNWLVNGYHLDPQTGLPTTHPMRLSILQPIDVSQLTTATISYESIDVEILYAMYSVLTTENTFIRRVTSVASGSTLDLSGGDKLYIAFYNGASSGATAITKDNITNIMLNTGSTALPYEPYGYKIPISSANTTTPVYLGEVETTRAIKEAVFKGDETENWGYSSSGNNARVYLAIDSMAKSPSISTHYQFEAIRTYPNLNEYCINNASALVIGVDINSITSAADFKAYLQQQYAAGTPVTVWYVLATETTGIVDEPLRKIGDYADTLSMEQAGVSIPTNNGSTTVDVETTLKPSEVSLAYTGWHDATVKEWDGSQWQ